MTEHEILELMLYRLKAKVSGFEKDFDEILIKVHTIGKDYEKQRKDSQAERVALVRICETVSDAKRGIHDEDDEPHLDTIAYLLSTAGFKVQTEPTSIGSETEEP